MMLGDRETIFERVIQWLYLYKTSVFYQIHLVFVVLLGLCVMGIYLKERQYWRLSNAYEQRKIALRVRTDEHIELVKQETEREVSKLTSSLAYTKYLQDKSNPGSFYNRQMDDVSDIVLSDEQQIFSGKSKGE